MSFLDWLFGTDTKRTETRKRIFVSFAIEDRVYRDYLKEQARNQRSPFDFIDMSAKKAWPQDKWKTMCNSKISRCHGVIVLLSENTARASGVKWEIQCALQQKKKIIGLYIRKNERHPLPYPLKSSNCMEWNWKNLETFINNL